MQRCELTGVNQLQNKRMRWGQWNAPIQHQSKSRTRHNRSRSSDPVTPTGVCAFEKNKTNKQKQKIEQIYHWQHVHSISQKNKTGRRTCIPFILLAHITLCATSCTISTTHAEMCKISLLDAWRGKHYYLLRGWRRRWWSWLKFLSCLRCLNFRCLYCFFYFFARPLKSLAKMRESFSGVRVNLNLVVAGHRCYGEGFN